MDAWVLMAIVVMCVCSWMAGGCVRKPMAAAIPSNQLTPVVWNDNTRDVLLGMGEKDAQVLASALEQNTEGGSCIYVDHLGYIYNPDGSVYTDKDGKPLRTRTRVIAKLHSLADLQGVAGAGKVRYVVGGYDYVKELPEGMKHKDLTPCALMLDIDNLQGAAVADNIPDRRRAAAEERGVILKGMADLATAQGAAYAVAAKATAEGVVDVATAAGKHILGRVLATWPLEVAVEGARNVTLAAMETKAGRTEKVVAEGDAAAALKEASAAVPPNK